MPDGGLSPDAAVARSVAALADPTRAAIVRLLIDGELSVGEIAERLPVSRPAVSKHLQGLEGAGLAVVRAEGTRRLYTIEPATPRCAERAPQAENAAMTSTLPRSNIVFVWPCCLPPPSICERREAASRRNQYDGGRPLTLAAFAACANREGAA